jgi:hypothetical protein
LTSRNATLEEEEIAIRVDLDDSDVLDGHPRVAGLTGHALAGKHPRRPRRAADGTRRTVKHGAVRGPSTAETVPLDHALEAAPLRATDDVDLLVGVEDIGEHRVTGLGLVTFVHRNLAEVTGRRNAGSLEMALDGLRRIAPRTGFHQTELHRLVAVAIDGLALNNDARPRLDDGHGHRAPVVVEDLGHAHFLAENAAYHVNLTVRRRP